MSFDEKRGRVNGRRPLPGALLGAALTACASGAGHQGAEVPPVTPPGATPGQEATAPEPGSPAAPAAATQAETAAPAANTMPDTPPDPSRSLPEVTLENVGLHIGGQANDAASKAPFERAIEARFDDFLGCYRLVLEPEKGGTFGVDLFIQRQGGSPEVRQPRTGMKGSEFRDCMVAVFETVEFEKPPKGPTVISYSLRFQVSGS